MKISLVYPPSYERNLKGYPLGLAYLSAYLKKSFEVDIYDYNGRPFRRSLKEFFKALRETRPDVVGIGTVVRATDLEANQPEQFTILGAWDSDPERGIVSYLSPVAQSLLNHKTGDEVEFEIHGVRHHHRIDAIEPFKPTPNQGQPAATDEPGRQLDSGV